MRRFAWIRAKTQPERNLNQNWCSGARKTLEAEVNFGPNCVFARVLSSCLKRLQKKNYCRESLLKVLTCLRLHLGLRIVFMLVQYVVQEAKTL